jgi:phosphatidate cytidylyltransferase
MAAGGWEWGRLNQSGAGPALALGAAVALGGVAALLGGWTDSAPAALWWSVALMWVVGGAFGLHQGPAVWPLLPRTARWAVGLLALWAAWLALTQARGVGLNFMLSVMCLVWMADIAAYFGGRALGRHKLAPSISPGKSWEGVAAGMVGVLVLSGCWIWLVDGRAGVDGPSVFTRLLDGLGVAGLIAALLCLCGLSVVGDLIESLVKRAAGAKDSSGLLPGHGGVLDRVDALLPVLPAALALSSLSPLPGPLP